MNGDLPASTAPLSALKKNVRNEHREMCGEGGYIRVDDAYYQMAMGKMSAEELPRNCFYANLELIRRRNKPNDKLVVASLNRDGRVIHHCFIMDGDWIIDCSNFMRKKIDRDYYFAHNEIVDYKFLKVIPSLNGDIISFIAQTLKMTGRRKIPKQQGSMDAAMRSVINL